MTQTTDALSYDGLNRLTQAVTSNPSLPLNVTKNVSYDAIGNITAKSDVGTYSYDPARVHAVASIAPGATGTVTASYAYDANGNMLTGRGRTVTWTSFDMMDAIVQGTNSVSFTYDSDHARLKQVSSDGSTKYYLNDSISGAMAEKIIGASLSVTWNNYIMLGGEMVALRVTGATTQTRYFHKDHLGSIVALTDESGAVVERDSFDAWGQRRMPTGQDDPLYPGQSITSQITRGYTGHEQLDSVGLVHMNGRIYEPVIGKMMSPDPTVPNPIDGQSYNRYSYVYNNPLSLTDPTGFQADPPRGIQRDRGNGIGRNGEIGVGRKDDGGAVGDQNANAGTSGSRIQPKEVQLACMAGCLEGIIIGPGAGVIIEAVPPAAVIGVIGYGIHRLSKMGPRASNSVTDNSELSGTNMMSESEENKTDEAKTTQGGTPSGAEPGATAPGEAPATDATNPAGNTTPEEKTKMKAKDIRALNQAQTPPAEEGGTPGNNQAQNKAFNDATQGLTKEQKRQVHDEITGQNLGYHDIKAIADEIRNGN